jgi:hypothetical protein
MPSDKRRDYENENAALLAEMDCKNLGPFFRRLNEIKRKYGLV